MSADTSKTSIPLTVNQNTPSELSERDVAIQKAQAFHLNWVKGQIGRTEETVRAVALSLDDPIAMRANYTAAFAQLKNGYDVSAILSDGAAAGPNAVAATQSVEALGEAQRAIGGHEQCERYLARVFPHARLSVGLPPNWKETHAALSTPAIVLACFYGAPSGPDLPRDGLNLWLDAIRLAVEHAHRALSGLPDRVTRTHRAGLAILDAAAQFQAILRRAVFYLTGKPLWGTVAQDQTNIARAELAALANLDIGTPLEELLTAVKADSEAEQRETASPIKTRGAPRQYDPTADDAFLLEWERARNAGLTAAQFEEQRGDFGAVERTQARVRKRQKPN
jgi:hypothetical protein